MRASFICLAILMIASPLLLADYHYASHTGSNTYPYTSWETATDSIKYAISAADPGDTVYIGSGEYHEIVVCSPADSNLAIIGSGMDSTYWWWHTPGSYTFRSGNNMLIESIHFSHTITGCISSGLGNNVLVRGCKFTVSAAFFAFGHGRVALENCWLDSCYAGMAVWGASRVDIRNNLVDKVYESSAFDLIAADTAIIENNIIIDCRSEGIRPETSNDTTLIRNNLIYNHDRMFGRVFGDCWNCPILINNTFHGIANFSGSPWAAITNASPIILQENNAISRVPYAAIVVFDEGSRRIRASYFNLWLVGALAIHDEGEYLYYDTVGITYQDPMYVSIDSGNFRLQAYSPLIDAGDPSILDVDGTRSDIGCYGGPHGAFYDYLDLPPRVPDSLSFHFISDTVFLNWRQNHEYDFYTYQIFRDTIPGFTPSAFNLIAETDTAFFVDSYIDPTEDYFYRVAAEDNQRNLSGYSIELAVYLTGTEDEGGAEMPAFTSIETNYPNPFNSSTTIVYKVANLGPLPAQINIDIYDILGRLVRTLVDERKEIGTHRVVWDGKGDRGEDLPSGVYFARICQWQVEYLTRHHKLLLAK